MKIFLWMKNQVEIGNYFTTLQFIYIYGSNVQQNLSNLVNENKKEQLNFSIGNLMCLWLENVSKYF